MNISVQTLLAKIEQELKLARSSTKQESLREKIYSIKILCELVLDEQQAGSEATLPVAAPTYQPAASPPAPQHLLVNQQVFQQPASLPHSKKLEMDEANGDSLFDF